MFSVADRAAAPETVTAFADRLAWLVGQSAVSDESAGVDRSLSSLVTAQLASRFRASWLGGVGEEDLAGVAAHREGFER
ncbi:hypothetical protein ASD08_37205 [Streptomyces sp. Root369]|nr:hypothetical protein ASD08_37205 [Streptomyces sp. Root369]